MFKWYKEKKNLLTGYVIVLVLHLYVYNVKDGEQIGKKETRLDSLYCLQNQHGG